jgi:hypothetical protein
MGYAPQDARGVEGAPQESWISCVSISGVDESASPPTRAVLGCAPHEASKADASAPMSKKCTEQRRRRALNAKKDGAPKSVSAENTGLIANGLSADNHVAIKTKQALENNPPHRRRPIEPETSPGT